MRELVLDTETTGLSRKADPSKDHGIIEIACVELVDKQITGKKFHTFLNPYPIKIQTKASQIHGITQEELNDKPTFSEVKDELLDFIDDAELIIHNAHFDISFLNREFSKLRRDDRPKREFRYVDTLAMARETFPFERNDLNSLARKFNVGIKRDKHGALVDSEILARIYIKMTDLNGSTQV